MNDSLTLTQVLWMDGGLVVVIVSLLFYIWKRMEKRVDDIAGRIDRGELAEFKAMYLATRDQWQLWRNQLENRLNDHSRSIKENSESIARILGRLNGYHK